MKSIGSVTFLTGASSGLGWSLAALIAADGSAVALAARRKSELEELAAKIRDSGGKALPISCDVTDRDSVHSAVHICEQELGPVDCLIANAGVGGAIPPEQFTAGAVERVLRTNLFGPVYCIEAVLPGMLQRKSGHIVGISSLASYRGLPNSPAYCASKSGLNAMLESLRLSLRPHKIAVTIVCPGFVRTPMTARNRNPMPFLMDQEDAAKHIYRAIRQKKTMYSFPWPLATVMKIARILPDPLYDRAFAGAKIRKE